MSKLIYFNGLLSKYIFSEGGISPQYIVYHDLVKIMNIPKQYNTPYKYFGINCSFDKYPYTNRIYARFHLGVPSLPGLDSDFSEKSINLSDFRKSESNGIKEILDSEFKIKDSDVYVYNDQDGLFYKGTGLYTGKYINPIPIGCNFFDGKIGGICDDTQKPCTHYVTSFHPNGKFIKGDEIYDKFLLFADPKDLEHFKS
jgi:hypothetical protein